MGTLWTLLIVAIVVVVVAYALGVAFRRRNERPAPRKPGSPSVVNRPRPLIRAAAGSEARQVEALTEWLLTQAFEQTGVHVANEKLALERVQEAAQKAVLTLKTQPNVTISLPFLTADASGPKHFETQITRDVLEELSRY